MYKKKMQNRMNNVNKIPKIDLLDGNRISFPTLNSIVSSQTPVSDSNIIELHFFSEQEEGGSKQAVGCVVILPVIYF